MEEHYVRHAIAVARTAMADTPVVVVHGPRQVGKSTMVSMIAKERKLPYITFDDTAERMAATADPVGYVEQLVRGVVLDEVQRVPEIMLELKRQVDLDRTPGRFILTGSSNLLTVPVIADALAGRMEVIELHPLTQSEIERTPNSIVSILQAPENIRDIRDQQGINTWQRIVVGGFPAALHRSSIERTHQWLRQLVDAIVVYDLPEERRIRSTETMKQVLTATYDQMARPFNLEQISAPFKITRPTVHQHVQLLERHFLSQKLSAWAKSTTDRLVKSAKLLPIDTGIACALLQLGTEYHSLPIARRGQLMEAFALCEIRRLLSCIGQSTQMTHYRDRDGYEVDAIVEWGNETVTAIEVKAASSVATSDFRGIDRFERQTKVSVQAGIVFYSGHRTLPFGPRRWAVPIAALWR
jgi:predicted AAA+ superfamily ATPase